MNDQVIASILQQYGSLGLVIGVAGYALRYLHNQLVESLEKRVADAQAFATKLLALADTQHAVIEKVAAAMTDNTDANHELRTVIENVLTQRQQLSAPRRPGG